jgi:hypothetical protein
MSELGSYIKRLFGIFSPVLSLNTGSSSIFFYIYVTEILENIHIHICVLSFLWYFQMVMFHSQEIWLKVKLECQCISSH